jgi:hypothetical protein
MAFLPKILRSNSAERQAMEHRAMIRREAKIGGTLFGPIPKGHNREFFCLDEHTWVWHEEWTNQNGKHQSVTTRYEVRPDGILKVQNDGSYQTIAYEEARNLFTAAQMYLNRVTPFYTSVA